MRYFTAASFTNPVFQHVHLRSSSSNKNNNSRMKKVGSGSLQISTIQENDAGVYTCRAINLEDSIDSDALLTVLGKFETGPPVKKQP